MTLSIQVAAPPETPLLIYDGECNFCKFWIIRWQHATAHKVEYIASQNADVSARFLEIPRAWFDESVVFVETDGKVYRGAEAVLRSLVYARYLGWPLWFYQDFPGVKPLAEWAYQFVAKRRETFSLLTRLLWGRAGAVPEYNLTAWIFLRLLALIYLSAFLSLGSQIGGLLGNNGILPAKHTCRPCRGISTRLKSASRATRNSRRSAGSARVTRS